MTEVYDRIWAGVVTDEYRGMVGTKIRVWGNDPRVGTDDPAIEYVRGDLVEALKAENQRLREALDPDNLAQIIRAVDGDNRLGAGALAEKISAALRDTEEAE